MSVPKKAGAAALVLAAGLTGSLTASAVSTSAASTGAGQEIGSSAGSAADRPGRIRNVIYLLGDGMGRTHVTAGRNRYYGVSGRLNMERLPAVGHVSTYSVQKLSGQPGEADFDPQPVTDSASAATTWSSGVKTYNAALGIDAKGRIRPTLMELAKRDGYRTGNVSTAEITDATPGAQASHVLARGCQGPEYSADSCQDTEVTGSPLPTTDLRVTPVADQMARNGTADVILGGGLSRFDAADERALRRQGYEVLGSPAAQAVATGSDLASAHRRKVFGLFNSGHMTVTKFKREHPDSTEAQEPALPEMTTKAISLLTHRRAGSHKGFYLQVEGALIDKRSHANDAAQALEEIKAFDDAVKVAVDFAKRDGHTLVIVTADHETGGFSIVEQGTFTNAEAATPPRNADDTNPANNSTPSRPDDQVLVPGRSTGPVNGAGSDDPANFAPATFRTPDDPSGVQDGSLDASLWLAYVSGNHTGEDVPVFGYGPGSGGVDKSIDNTDLFHVMGRALGVAR